MISSKRVSLSGRLDNPRPLYWRIALLILATACLYLLTAGVPAQAADTAAEQYRQDIEYCNNTPGIDKQACLREAGAALETARKNELVTPSPEIEHRNRLKRCNSLPAGQRDECIRLMTQDNTQVEGSVFSGGIIRELTIPIPADQAH